MSVHSGLELLSLLGPGQKSIPCFDIAGGNVDIIHAICRELEEYQAVAFLSSTASSIMSYHGFHNFTEQVRNISDNYSVKVASHLDHVTEIDQIELGLKAGFSSVMIDGSMLPLEQNVYTTNVAAELVRGHECSIEAELGVIGGKEDNVRSNHSAVPSLKEVESFLARTDIDFFAPAVGTVHGTYNETPFIDWNLVEELSASIDKPLVLHGASGLEQSLVVRIVDNGFRKLNYATSVRNAFLEGMMSAREENQINVKPQAFLGSGRRAVRKVVREVLDLITEKNQLSGSEA